MNHPHEKSPLITPEVPAIYKSAIKQVADSWNNEAPDYDRGVPGSMQYYTTMRTVLTNRMITAEPGVEKVAKAISNQAGLEVISRFFYIGAAKAALQGYSVQELGNALYQPTSFRQLVPLTREINRSARRIEMHLGLTDISQPQLDEFNLDDGGLRITKYALHRFITRANLEMDGHLTHEQAFSLTPDDDPIRCEGLKSGLTTYAYKYMLDICVKDPALFETTIDMQTAVKEDPAA
ncbi:MAG TPA: hypothetical protein VIM31_03885 [Candidatus Microsaccharimonas sp.]|jgi:hypothetical protein